MIFLFDLGLEGVEDRSTEFHRSPTTVPGALLVTAVLGAKLEEKFALMVVAEKDDGEAGVVESWLHGYEYRGLVSGLTEDNEEWCV